MAEWLAQRSEGCEFESNPGTHSVVSQIPQKIYNYTHSHTLIFDFLAKTNIYDKFSMYNFLVLLRYSYIQYSSIFFLYWFLVTDQRDFYWDHYSSPLSLYMSHSPVEKYKNLATKYIRLAHQCFCFQFVASSIAFACFCLEHFFTQCI